MRFFTVALAIIVGCVASTLAACTYTASTGASYNLAGMTLTKGPDYKFLDSKQNTFYLNICAACFTSCGTGSTVCQQAGTGSTLYSCGILSTQKFSDYNPPSGGVSLFYGGGAVCKSTNGPRTTQIQIKCGTGQGNIYEITEATCSYVIFMQSQYACAGGSSSGGSTGGGGGNGDVDGLSPGAIFDIIFFVGFAAYFAIGSLVNWKVRGATGTEVIPNHAFWTDLPNLMKDGVFFVKGKITGSYTPV